MIFIENPSKSKKKKRKRLITTTVIVVSLIFIVFLTAQIPSRFRASFDELSQTHPSAALRLQSHSDPLPAPTRPAKLVGHRFLSGLDLGRSKFGNFSGRDSGLCESAAVAAEVGRRVWAEAGTGADPPVREVEVCPNSVAVSGAEFDGAGNVTVIPCGMTLGSSVTVVGRPRRVVAAAEVIAADVAVGEFKVELQGLKAVEGEVPPAVLHFNPRLKGDWSGRPVIEMNNCFRMQWGTALRCDGLASPADDETVDGKVKCEKWIQGDGSHLEETKSTWWLNKLMGSRNNKVTVDWPFPFAEDKLFVLTISARLEGYHINVDGRHVASFPYRSGFTLEDATGLSVSGDIDVHFVYAANLPSSHPSFAPQLSLEMSAKWRAPPLPKGEVELFIGILSAGNHFAERMALRKSWMQHKLIRSSNVVARFFVALHPRKEVNTELIKEAEFFGDIVIVPYLDNYDLVVLKTVAICEHGVRSLFAKYVMKCDDDTFVNVEAVLGEAKKIPQGRSFYIGSINYDHIPLRSGKWAVTYEEWPEEAYPPYANGPGYIISSDLANYVFSEFQRNKLRLFKMEDVSMGMWVEKFNSTKPVEYVHDFKFCQSGCMEGCMTAHYQSPRQMICMWEKFQRQTIPQCCNMR